MTSLTLNSLLFILVKRTNLNRNAETCREANTKWKQKMQKIDIRNKAPKARENIEIFL